MIHAYARVSTTHQRTDRQLMGVEAQFSDQEVVWYEDIGVSGTVAFSDRPAGGEVLAGIRSGEITTLVVWELSRLGRSLQDILSVLDVCYEVGCQVIVTKEHLKLLDEDGSPNPVTKMLVAVIGSLAEMERDAINIRIREGIEAARRRGVYRGRKRGSTESSEQFMQKEKSKKIADLLSEEYPVTYISRILSCSPNTVYKVKTHLEKIAVTV